MPRAFGDCRPLSKPLTGVPDGALFAALALPVGMPAQCDGVLR